MLWVNITVSCRRVHVCMCHHIVIDLHDGGTRDRSSRLHFNIFKWRKCKPTLVICVKGTQCFNICVISWDNFKETWGHTPVVFVAPQNLIFLTESRVCGNSSRYFKPKHDTASAFCTFDPTGTLAQPCHVMKLKRNLKNCIEYEVSTYPWSNSDTSPTLFVLHNTR